MSNYQGKRVYITGGSSGIGFSIASELVRQGAHVIVSARGESRLNEAVEALRAHALHADLIIEGIRVDVSDRAAVEETALQILERLGGLDILINNAGIAFVGELEETTPEPYRQMMEVNYFGMVWTTLAFLPHFRAQQHGTIAAVSSTLGLMGLYGYSAYAASKYAITGFCDCLRQDLLREQIQVSVLFPADTDTPQLAEENELKPDATRELAGKANLVSPEFVASYFLKHLARGRYHIIPGFENRAVVWMHHKLPWLVRGFIDRSLKSMRAR